MTTDEMLAWALEHEAKGHSVVPADHPSARLYGATCFHCEELAEGGDMTPALQEWRERKKAEALERQRNAPPRKPEWFPESDFSMTAHRYKD